MDENSNMCPTCGHKLGGMWGNRCYRCKGRPRSGETRKCGECGTDFYAPQWKLNDIARNQGTYCSRECKHLAQMAVPAVHSRAADVVDGTLQCTTCGLVKPLGDFGADLRKKNGKKSACNACARDRSNAWRQRYPERYAALKKIPKTERQKLLRRDRDLQENYGLTSLDYERVLASQGGGCAICGSSPNGRGRSGSNLHIDHDHACCPGVGSCGGCIRGLLCSNCNTMVGLAKDDPERLLAAVRYLRQER